MDIVETYHQASKHAPDRYAPGPEYMDWENQPEPFRWFSGAPQQMLPFRQELPDPPFEELWQPGRVPPQPVNLPGLSQFLQLSLGLSAWKEFQGVRWPLRCHPSSGNLHPIEGYVVTPSLSPLPAGVHHYLSRDHLLETRFTPDSADPWQQLLPDEGFLLGLSLIHQRETWKYGLRAFRYCQINLGHAAAAASFAAASLGWRAILRTDAGDDELTCLMGLNKPTAPEAEHPGLLLAISPGVGHSDLTELAKLTANGAYRGHPNHLCRHPVTPWPGVEEAARLCHKGPTPLLTGNGELSPLPALTAAPTTFSAGKLIRTRRSGQRYDGRTPISSNSFFRILDRLLPRPGIPPWALLNWPPQVHMVLMVHRVAGMVPGLYLMPRSLEVLPWLRAHMEASFLWETPSATPAHLPLFLLRAGNYQVAASQLACQQGIAADGAFSLAMLADFSQGLSAGPWGYRALHWEAGVLGQILYLAAEEEGNRGTGIGCFFDDLCHRLLGLDDHRFQDIYHFTVGNALEDGRLTTHSPYAHLNGRE